MVDNLSYLSGGTVSIDAPEQQAPVAIENPDNTYNVPLPPAIAEARANKASMGVSNKTTLNDQILKDGIANGQESQLRQTAASEINKDRLNQFRGLLNWDSAVPAQYMQTAKLSNPDSVFEEQYGNEMVSHLNWVKNPDNVAQDSWLYKSNIDVPPDYEVIVKNGGSKYVAYTEFLKTLKENAESQIGPKSIVGNLIADLASLGFYSEYRLRQQGIFDPGLLLGTNLNEQGLQLYNRAITDFDLAKSQAKGIFDRLYRTDPVLAHNWINGIIGQSQSEEFFNNISTILNVGGVASGLIKPLDVAKSVRLWQATRDMTRTPAASIPPKVAATAMSGNVSQSAVEKVVIDNINQFRGTNDPIRELKERLSSNYDIDKAAAASDPGRLGREQANRISDVIDSAKDVFIADVLQAKRVNKTPAPVTMRANIDQVRQGIADRNRGIDNTVLNVSDPIYIPGINLYAHNVAIGTADGDVFHSAEEAIANAKMNGWIIKGDLKEDSRNLAKKAQLEGALKGIETSAANVVKSYVAMGKAAYKLEPTDQALRSIELLRQRIQALPRHDTGVTIERQAIPFTPEEMRMADDGGMRLEREGTGFYINRLHILPKDAEFTRDALMTPEFTGTFKEKKQQFRIQLANKTISTQIPPSWWNGYMNAFWGRGRNPAERLSITENQQRVVATHGPSVFLNLYKKGDPTRSVPMQDRLPFDRMIRYLQKAFNEDTKAPGINFNYPSEIDHWWQTNIGRSPSPEAVDAYFEYKNRGIDDLNMRDMIVDQRKRELELSLHQIKFRDKSGNDNMTSFFEGARRWELPTDYRRLQIIKNEQVSGTPTRSMFIKNRDQLNAHIKEGKAKLVQIADPNKRPLGDISPGRIEYVLAYGDRHQEKPMPIGGHVNRLGGGHLINEWGWYAKQARVDDGVYEGDQTIMNFMTQAQAKEALPHLENVRQIFQKYKKMAPPQSDMEAIERWESEGGLVPHDILDDAAEANKVTGIPFGKHYGWYFGKNAYLKVDEPIHIVARDNNIIGLPKAGEALKQRYLKTEVDEFGNTHQFPLKDGTKGDGSILAKAMVPFTQERDAEGIWTMRNTGTQQHPLFAYEPAPYLDPVTAMERSWSRISRTAYLADMKDYGAMHWAEQAKGFLELDKGDLRENAIHYINDDNLKYKSGTPNQIKMQLESNRKQLIDFLGRPSWFDTSLRDIGQKLADGIYGVTGGKSNVSVSMMSALPKMRSPTSVIRSLSFNGILGAYSLPAFWTQLSTFVNVMAISPRQAPASAIATLLYAYSKVNRTPEMLDHLDNMASQMAIKGFTNWKSGWFKEFVSNMESTGFHNIGNEHAFAGNSLQTRVITRGTMAFLDFGRLPFNLGAGFTRIGGYATAFLEHRLEFPFDTITDAQHAGILQRAALLDHNMSSAFSTKLHTGALSIPMQFRAYDIRLAEMQFGKNLTPAEKARLFTASAFMYGVKYGGLATLGIPTYYLAKEVSHMFGQPNPEAAVNYVPGENPLADMVSAGFPAMALKYLTGMGDYSKGTLYNVSKWGNKGDPLATLLENDSGLRNLIGGVAGNAFYNTFQDNYGMRAWVWSIATDGGHRPLTVDDVLDNFSQISSVWNTRRLFYAIAHGKWLTRSGQNVDDITKANALVQFITGLSPMAGTDVFAKEQLIKDIDTQERFHENQIVKLIHRAVDSANDNDPDQYKKYMRQVESELIYIPQEKQDKAIQRAYEIANVNQKDRINYELLFKRQHDWPMFNRTQGIK